MGSRTLSLFLYNALLPVGLLYMAPAALVKMRRRGGSWADFGQRLGFWSRERCQAMDSLPQGRRIWVHAVSVGEVGVARKLIVHLLRQAGDLSVILTTTTPTAYRLAAEAEQSFPGRVVALYSPLDVPGVASRVLKQFQPYQIILVEAEVWPNMVSRATRAGIPVSLVNARLSARSERRYVRFHWLVSPIFQMLTRVMVQEEGDRKRLTAIGARDDAIMVTGSIKYDPQGSAPAGDKVKLLGALLARVGLDDRPLILAASTHDGEERVLASIYQELATKIPRLGLLVVPRHFERGPQVVEELRTLGLQPALRSHLDGESFQSADVMVIDSTGELRSWLELVTVVVMGKSFLAEGGQNPAEAVMAGKPVVFGPHMENFGPLVELLLAAQGAVQVPDLASLKNVLVDLLADEAARSRLAEAGLQALMRHDGATARTADLLLAETCKNCL